MSVMGYQYARLTGQVCRKLCSRAAADEDVRGEGGRLGERVLGGGVAVSVSGREAIGRGKKDKNNARGHP